ncbi:MAG: hypothetical protein PWQ54_94 [Bacteroidales bacterium]|jgi:hypothetical protein|nr:hypothetical protein [Bacteroidales bacterium]
MLVLIGAVLIFDACTSSKKVAENPTAIVNSCYDLNIEIRSDKNSDRRVSDRRVYELVSFELQDNCLLTVVNYSGGCTKPEISVNLLEIDRGAYPKQALIDLVIQGEDACREWVTDSIAINIAYLEAMARDGGINLRFAGQEKEFLYALPLK